MAFVVNPYAKGYTENMNETADGEHKMREVDPKTTNRAMSYEYDIDAPMPVVTIFKTMDMTHLLTLAKKGYSFNMLTCWCIARAAQCRNSICFPWARS